MIHWLLADLAESPFARGGGLPPGILSARERELVPTGSAKRRREWLLGRWAAKLLVRHHIRAQTGCSIELAAVSVLPSPAGAPVVELSSCGLSGVELPSLSLSHSHDVALAALTDEAGVRIGADLEEIAPRSRHFVADYLTADERAAVEAAARAEQELWVTAIWSAKEAVLKALGLGLSVDPLAIGCCLAPRAAVGTWSSFTVEARGLEARLGPARGAGEPPALRGCWRAAAGFVLTLAAWDRGSES